MKELIVSLCGQKFNRRWKREASCIQTITGHPAALNGKRTTHEALNHSANEYVKGLAHTNGIESVWAVLKRGLIGTFRQVSVKHLNRYVNEFTFRLNEGNCETDTVDRLRALFGAMPGKTITYKDLTA